MKKWLVLSLIIIGIGVSVFFILKGGVKKTFQFMKVEQGTIEETISTTGNLQYLKTISVAAQTSGIINAIYADFNQHVRKGQLLATMENSMLRIAYQEADSALVRAKFQLAQSQKDYDQTIDLFAQNYKSQSDVDAANLSLVTAKDSANSAQLQLNKAKLNLSYANFISPMDGVIVDKNIKLGDAVNTSLTNVYVIANDLSRMQCLVTIDEGEISKIKRGQKTRFSVQSFSDLTFEGIVTQVRIDPEVVQNVVNYTVVVEIFNKKMLLMPGMTANMDIIVNSKTNVYKLPNSALKFRPSADLLKKIYQGNQGQRDANGNGGNSNFSQNSSVSNRGGNTRQLNTALLWTLDEATGKLKPLRAKIGATDGQSTEVEFQNISNGFKIISSYSVVSNTSSRTTTRQQSGFGGGFFPGGPDAKEKMLKSKTIIDIQNATKVYASGDARVTALNGVDLQIHEGEFLAIMGASGSGKSTLMNILGCLDQLTEGEYLLDNISVKSLNRNQLAVIRNQKIGFVFQGFNLLSRTSALDNVELPLLYNHTTNQSRAQTSRVTGRAAKTALEQVGLFDRMQHFPNQLSGGQQQRVAIARALVNQPSLILADEPTGNLDSKTSIEIMALFQDLNEDGITIVLVTHEMDVANYAKRIVEFRDGKIIRDHLVGKRHHAHNDLKRIRQDAVENV